MIPRRTIGAAIGILIGAALLALPSAASAAEPALQPGQPVVDAGQALAFSGSGFTPGERVVTWATAPDQAVIGGTYADAGQNGGEIAFRFSVPANALGGRWAMTAYGLASKVPWLVAFRIGGAAVHPQFLDRATVQVVAFHNSYPNAGARQRHDVPDRGIRCGRRSTPRLGRVVERRLSHGTRRFP